MIPVLKHSKFYSDLNLFKINLFKLFDPKISNPLVNYAIFLTAVYKINKKFKYFTRTEDAEVKSKVQCKSDLDEEKKTQVSKINEILTKDREVKKEISGLSLLANHYRLTRACQNYTTVLILLSDSEDGNSDTSNSDEDSDGLEIRNAL